MRRRSCRSAGCAAKGVQAMLREKCRPMLPKVCRLCCKRCAGDAAGEVQANAAESVQEMLPNVCRRCCGRSAGQCCRKCAGDAAIIQNQCVVQAMLQSAGCAAKDVMQAMLQSAGCAAKGVQAMLLKMWCRRCCSNVQAMLQLYKINVLCRRCCYVCSKSSCGLVQPLALL